MAGGKGKSSGGKSSGGKVGADGNKKQQSHSSKAGLQVSIAQNPAKLSYGVCEEAGSIWRSNRAWIPFYTHPTMVAIVINNTLEAQNTTTKSVNVDAPTSNLS